jgi:hypothetical protein
VLAPPGDCRELGVLLVVFFEERFAVCVMEILSVLGWLPNVHNNVCGLVVYQVVYFLVI